MPKDRREDRHGKKGRLIRPDPEDLWTKLGEKAGQRKRNEVISRLIEGYLEGRFVVDEEAPRTEANGG